MNEDDLYDVCGRCRDGEHERCSARAFPKCASARCACAHGAEADELARLLPGLPDAILSVQNEDDGGEGGDHVRNVARACELLLAERERLTRDLAHLEAQRQESERQRIAGEMEATRLEQERNAARAKVAEVERKLGQVSEGWKQKDAALYEANARLRLVEVEPDLAWRWQGDGHDDPASLTCPVIMTADTLRGFVADRARVAGLEAQLAAAPSGLRVAALLEALKDAADAEHRLGELYLSGDPIGDAHDAARDAYRESARLIRQHLGDPTAEERAAAEVLAVDASEEDIDPEGDDYALRLVQRINAWMDSDDETIAGRRAALLECAAVAIAALLACDAADGRNPPSRAQREAEERRWMIEQDASDRVAQRKE